MAEIEKRTEVNVGPLFKEHLKDYEDHADTGIVSAGIRFSGILDSSINHFLQEDSFEFRFCRM